MSQDQHHPDPSLFWRAVTGYQLSAAIRAAVDLDLFSAVAQGATSAASLATACKASERGVRILADYLVINGMLEKVEGAYALTQDSAVFLDRRSPAYIGGITGFMQSERLLDDFHNLTETVRRGTVSDDRPDSLSVEHPMWVDFAESMAAMMGPASQYLAELAVRDAEGELKALDVAAGHGMFGIAVAQASAQAHVTALDWPAVLETAEKNAEKHGVRDRYTLLPGSAFEVDLGGPYDVVLVPNFFHHFDTETCTTLAKRFCDALKPGGRMLTLEFVPHDDRVSPPDAGAFSMVMLATTPHGDAYTFAEYDQIFRDAGFEQSSIYPLPNGAHSAIASPKAA